MSDLKRQSGTFVLVHGGRHGGWAWRPIVSRLRAEGFEVLTPTLTGLGDRAHLLNREIGLDTHIEDLVATFKYEDLDDVVLVAHSYAGMVVAGAMEQLAPHVRKLINLDARMPIEGESLLDLAGPVYAEELVETVNRDGEGWFVPISDSSYWGLTDPDQIAWVNSKITPQPMKTYTDAVGPTDHFWTHPGTFIEATPSVTGETELERVRERASRDSNFHHRKVDACHDAMVSAPDEVTALIIEAAVN